MLIFYFILRANNLKMFFFLNKFNTIYRNYVLFFFSLFTSFLFSQKNELDTINQLSFSGLIKGYYNNTQNINIARRYAEAYLKKTRKHFKNDPIAEADAYELLASLYNDATKIIYLDTIIQLTKHLNHTKYPAETYNDKGGFYYLKGDLKKSLINYLEADKYTSQSSNEPLFFAIKHNIGIIKGEIGDYQEALKQLKEVNHYYLESNNPEYLNSQLSLSNLYIYNQELENATIINRRGYNVSVKQKSDNQFYFTLNEGINQFYKGNSQYAIDSILKVLGFFNKIDNKKPLTYALIYLGKSFKSLENDTCAIHYYKKSDDLFNTTNIIVPESINTYEYLISYYKQKKDINNHLFYINKLLSIDSIMYNRYRYLVKNITTKYEVPKLINEKENLINGLKKSKKTASLKIQLLVAILIILFVISIIKNDFIL